MKVMPKKVTRHYWAVWGQHEPGDNWVVDFETEGQEEAKACRNAIKGLNHATRLVEVYEEVTE